MKKHFSCFSIFLCMIAAAGIIGCGSQPIKHHDDREIPEGPGLFSGKDGAFTLYSSEPAPSDDTRAENNAAAARQESDENAAYQEFEDWKNEKAAFEAFQQWKNSPEGAREYEEFLEWKRWQDYRDWRQQKETKDSSD